jgi:ABC-type transporter Mla subunit MlaD
MSNRRATASIFASPVLVGAVTTLVVIVAVFLAYNANTGLPFVPTRALKIQLPNGSQLVKGNEVREGGFRIGIIEGMSPQRLPNGTVGALVTLKLDRSAGAFPIDTTAIVRPRSALGLKYIELDRGTSTQTISDGGVLPIAQVRQEPDLDQVYGMFDAPTRSAIQTDLREFGNAFSGRGADLSLALRGLPRTLALLTGVASNLASPQTQLAGFFPALERVAGAVSPVAGLFAKSFTYEADTFAAISSSPRALQDTIAKGPDTLAVGTRSFAVQIPFLRDSAAFAASLNAASVELRRGLPALNGALRVGVPVTQRSQALYSDLQGALGALLNLAQAPTTNAALRGLTATVGTLQPQLRYLGPFITVCNYWNTFWGFVSEHLSAQGPTGSEQRALLNFPTIQNNGYNQAGVPVPANGEGVVANNGPPVFFHGAPYGHVITPQGQADCLYGQTGYINRAFKYGPSRFHIDIDPKAPGWLGQPQGSTFAQYLKGGGGIAGHNPSGGVGSNPTSVPPGETFTTMPGGLAAQLPATYGPYNGQ